VDHERRKMSFCAVRRAGEEQIDAQSGLYTYNTASCYPHSVLYSVFCKVIGKRQVGGRFSCDVQPRATRGGGLGMEYFLIMCIKIVYYGVLFILLIAQSTGLM